ncbi:MAG: phosphotransferase family protein [Acidiferrobacterales bacterium]|nr:phosphotransferase family protein [Acidiferrobacterales bacterium]
MSLSINPDGLRKLASWIAQVCSADQVEIEQFSQLDGGAIQQNWLVHALLIKNNEKQLKEFVLRTNAAATIAESRSREEEFRILQAAYQHGVSVPAPVAYCGDDAILGQGFSLVDKVDGLGFGPKVVKNAASSGVGEVITQQLAAEMAKIHDLDPAEFGLRSIGRSRRNHAQGELSDLRRWLDLHQICRPALEWGLRWAQRHMPEQLESVFIHRDFRTGNFLIHEDQLTAILDWEFSGFGDPMSDIGWFCAECWRFSRPDLEAGGLASRTTFYDAYEMASGRKIAHDAVKFWELVAHLRWAVIALQQGDRHLSGKEPSLAMAITSRIVDQLELIIMRMTGGNICQHAEDQRDLGCTNEIAPSTHPQRPHQSTGKDLLAIARASLSDSVLGELSSPNKLTALMVKNVLGIVEREHLYAGDRTRAEKALTECGDWSSDAELSEAIRAGKVDGEFEVAARITKLVAIRSEIFKPGFADPDELPAVPIGQQH